MTSNARPGTRIIGSVRSADGTGIVRIEDRYDTGIGDLWSALTDPRRLARWIAEVEGDLRPGGEFRARFTSGWEGTGRVETCEPPRRLLVTTRASGKRDEHVIEATLAADGGQTILVIETRGMPLDLIADYGAGWQVHAEDLAAHLAGRERERLARRADLVAVRSDMGRRPAGSRPDRRNLSLAHLASGELRHRPHLRSCLRCGEHSLRHSRTAGTAAIWTRIEEALEPCRRAEHGGLTPATDTNGTGSHGTAAD